MRAILMRIDKLLRGGFTRREQLEEGVLDVRARDLLAAGCVLGLFYGLFMGTYATLRGGPGAGLQLVATTLKVPLLFLLTLVVTFPSLYVFSALARSRLSSLNTLRLLLAAVTVNLALLASFGPVTGFFTLSTESYPFMILLNVVFFGVAGFVGLAFLKRALQTVFDIPMQGEKADTGRAPGTSPAAPLDPAAIVFNAWIIIYGVVGAQMGWILRPFIGAPSEPFQWFRARESNFFVAVWESFLRLFG